MVRNKLIHELVIEQKSDCQWIGKINNELVCEFNYYKDCKGKYWINDISTFDPFKEIGVGTKMIENALSIYNEIYVSTAEKHEIKTVGIKGDLRYTNEFSFEESDEHTSELQSHHDL